MRPSQVAGFPAIIALAVLSFSCLAADKPTLDHLYPPGAGRGTTNDVTFLGKFDPWPPKVWASAPGLDFQFTTNKGKAQLIVSPEAKLGPCLVRIYNDEGPSDPRIFVVGDKPELLESEPNNYFTKAQVVTNLLVTINGRLEKNGDVDSFRIDLKGGQWLDAAVDSYTLLAKLDPVLRLVTTNGYQLAWNHDFASLDPRLVWQAPYDLTGVIQVFGFAYPADSDIRLSGGPAAVYRLHLNVADQAPGDLRESPTENEPNNSATNAPSLELPATVIGTICPARDLDRFKLALKKDQTIEARVQAASLGSPLDAWLAIENSAGKENARNDDADNSRDPRLEWKAPEDGQFYVVVGSVTHQGTTDCRYHLSIKTLEPDYRVTSSADALAATPGSTNTLKLLFKRLRGFTNELSASVEHLPEGVRAEDLDIPAKDGDLSLKIVVATNAPASNGPFQVSVRDKASGAQRHVPFELVSRSENNGVPGGYSKLLVERTDDLWLTVKPPEQKPSTEKK
jgi:hypothetical protein